MRTSPVYRAVREAESDNFWDTLEDHWYRRSVVGVPGLDQLVRKDVCSGGAGICIEDRSSNTADRLDLSHLRQ